MSSELRLRANRANAALSTGPKTAAGKAHSSRNSRRHGFLARQILVGTESPAAFKELFDVSIAQWAPVNDVELGFIEEMTAATWRLRRAWAMETQMLETAMEPQPARSNLARLTAAFGDLAAGPALHLLHRYESRLHVMHQRALHSLLVLRQAGVRNEPNNSFVPNETPRNDEPNSGDFAPKNTVSTPKKPPRRSPPRDLQPPPATVAPIRAATVLALWPARERSLALLPQQPVAVPDPSLGLLEPPQSIVALRLPVLPPDHVLLELQPCPPDVVIRDQHPPVQIVQVGRGLHRCQGRTRHPEEPAHQTLSLRDKPRGFIQFAVPKQPAGLPVEGDQLLHRLPVPRLRDRIRPGRWDRGRRRCTTRQKHGRNNYDRAHRLKFIRHALRVWIPGPGRRRIGTTRLRRP